MPTEPSLILLDTHIWLWLASGVSKAISSKLRNLIEELTLSGSVRLSAMSIWEIGILTSKNRIALEPDPIEWVNRSIVATRVGIEVIDAEIALESALLLDFHGDPADRIIVTTAKKTGATLITFDKEILAYSKKNEFSALHL